MLLPRALLNLISYTFFLFHCKVEGRPSIRKESVFNMAGRNLKNAYPPVPESEGDDIVTEGILPSIDQATALSTAAIDEQMSQRRQSAANFKQLVPPNPHDYRRVNIQQQETSPADLAISKKIRHAISLREKWVYRRRIPEWVNYPQPRHSDCTVFVPPPYHPFEEPLSSSSHHVCQWQDGIVNIFADRTSVMRRRPEFFSPPLKAFADDLSALMAVVNHPESRSFCYRRLLLLQERFNMYILLNEDRERLAQIRVPHRDFYNVRKVDVHGKSFFNVAALHTFFLSVRHYRIAFFFFFLLTRLFF